MVKNDYPLKWPSITDQILGFLTSETGIKETTTGLVGLLVLCKKYEYEMAEEKEQLDEAMKKTIGVIGEIINRHMS